MAADIVSPPPHNPALTMPVNEDHCNAEPTSDNDKLIAAVQMGFHDLMRKQEEQAEKLHKAVEALKHQAPTPDKKTAFWNSYMKLADEHDKEFQRKYGTDLDTALIFAGLFSAVSSAFIIQIEPQLMTNSGAATIIVVVQSLLYTSLFTTLLAALLAVLGKQWIMHYEAAGSRGTIEQRGLERQRKLDGLHKWKFDTALQTFPLLLQLALLLFATALSVYLWTVHHAIAIIVQILTLFGFITYISLLMSTVISPDSPFQTPVAHFLLPLLSPLLHGLAKARKFINNVLASWTCSIKSGPLLLCVAPRSSTSSSPELESDFYHGYHSVSSPEVPAVLWVLETSTDPIMIEAAAEMAVDLQYPLDLDLASPMARLVDFFDSCLESSMQAGELVAECRHGMAHLAISCGRAYCWLRVIAQASPVQQDIPWIRHFDNILQTKINDPVQLSHLRNVVRIIDERATLVLDWDDPVAIHLALQVIPSFNLDATSTPLQNKLEIFLDQFHADRVATLDHSDFTNYVCCVNSFLVPMSPRFMTQKNKRWFRNKLIVQLFKALQVAPIDTALIARIIKTTAQLARNLVVRNPVLGANLSVATEASNFCSFFLRLGGSLDVLVSAVMLARFESLEQLVDVVGHSNLETQDIEWVYMALAHVQQLWEETRGNAEHPDEWDASTTFAVDSLLHHLLAFGASAHLTIPPLPAVNVILQAASISGDISFTAFLILCKAESWFVDPTLKPIMQRSEVWFHLGRITIALANYSEGSGVAELYTKMGRSLVNTDWGKSLISQDLPNWINAFTGKEEWGDTSWVTGNFSSVVRTVWALELDKQYNFSDESEESWALAVSALSKVWDSFEYPNLHKFIPLARCTVTTFLRVQYKLPSWPFHQRNISLDCRIIFGSQLGKALVKAAAHARRVAPARKADVEDDPGNISSSGAQEKQTLERAVKILEALGQKIGTEFDLTRGEVSLGGSKKHYRDWAELQKHFLAELDDLEASLSETQIT
ncbi:hypothetical protein DFH09DRAFT_1463649 [Mycena vulgaris]|nr:hypothetical protein DFH09DRAFT_1463649 [Mycena vulgaris]